MGEPLGSKQYVKEKIQTLVAKVQRLTSLLPLLGNPHTESVLLRSCLGLPKMMFHLRTMDTSNHMEALQDYDRVNREAVGVPLSDLQWQQANLPLSMGDLGSGPLRPMPLLHLLLPTSPPSPSSAPCSRPLLRSPQCLSRLPYSTS